jgi:hypothetical protein
MSEYKPTDIKRLDEARRAIEKYETLQEAVYAAPQVRPYSKQRWYWQWGGVQLVTLVDGRTYKQMPNNGSAVPIPPYLFGVDKLGRGLTGKDKERNEDANI